MPTATQECSSCHAAIWWAEKFPLELNDRGQPKMIPVNVDSLDAPNGNVEVWTETVIPSVDGGAAWMMHFRYLRKGDVLPDKHRRAVNHFATCPDAGKWRRKPADRQAQGWPRGSAGEAANAGGGG